MTIRQQSLFPLLLLLLAGVLSVATAWSGEKSWPHWRGPHRNDVVNESSRWDDGAWPLGEPAWTAEVGDGSSSPLVVDGRLYTLGWREGKDQLFCLDASTGRQLWIATYDAREYGRVATGDESFYSGPQSTPEFDAQTGFLYTLGVDGELRCWDTRRQGHRVWRLNLYDDFQVPQRPQVNRSGRRDYGYTSSPLVHRDWLLVEVGADVGNLIAFDKRTGEPKWNSAARDAAGHNGGPVPITVDRVPCVAIHTFEGLLVVRLDRGHEGDTVATYPWRTEFANNIATLAVRDNNVVLTSSYNHHKIARFRISLRGGAERVWEQTEASKVCSPVIHGDHVYWAWQTMTCLDFATGAVRWQGGKFGDPGSCVATSDDRLLVWAGEGDLFLVDSARRAPDRYHELAARRGVGGSDAWPHVVLADGRIYCKDRRGHLTCFVLQTK